MVYLNPYTFFNHSFTMDGNKFQEAIQPHINLIKECASEIGNPEDAHAFLASMTTMYGEGFTPPECYFECVLSPKGYKPGMYESLPVILPRYFAPDHPIVKPAYDAILNIFTEMKN